MGIRLVVFDMAGTTVEDNNNVHDALIKGFAKYNYSITLDDANQVMGIPKPVAIRSILQEKFLAKENIGEQVSNIHAEFLLQMLRFYQNDPSVRAKANAEETFRRLKEKGIKVCLDTGFSRDIVDTILARLNWKNNALIDLTISSDEVNNGRPYPDMILKAMDDLVVLKPEEVAKVGDTPFDLHEGTAAKCKYVIGITTGAYTKAELKKHKHTHLVDDLLQVVDIVSE